jgi:hypothetical protein
MKLDLIWDGSDLGDISRFFISITEAAFDTVGARLKLKTGKKVIDCLAWKYKDDIPLIIDELKPIFGLRKIGRHKCVIQKVKLLIARIVDENENIFTGTKEQKKDNLEKIREHIVFRHLFGVVTTGEFLWYRPSRGVMSFKEQSVSFDKNSSHISDINVKRWFSNDRGKILKIVKRLFMRIVNRDDKCLTTAVLFIRIKIDKTIRRLNGNMVCIGSGFMTRCQMYLTYIACDEAEESK